MSNMPFIKGKENVTHNVTDFKTIYGRYKAQRKQQRMNQQEQKRKNIAQKRLELDKAKEKDEKKTHHLLFRITSSMFASVKQTVTPVLSQNTKRENHQRPLKRAKTKTPPKQFNQRKLNKRTDKRGQQT